jgi:hypothetical protein
MELRPTVTGIIVSAALAGAVAITAAVTTLSDTNANTPSAWDAIHYDDKAQP